ncbi:hypothetical protein HELRODRAFT_70246 [Helobdella robusta]|uniref:Suppressor of cytokine signaling 2 n=1 Tax=Helobdella robusta TaxID=6412 RepID=T1G038_HELRO|nr:hypothetical protein HELRODRAFT_70246 [Helobdella robusta]ESN91526.1 hypothetical protein HELRODRAFT_70246 [Helobdella robusta]
MSIDRILFDNIFLSQIRDRYGLVKILLDQDENLDYNSNGENDEGNSNNINSNNIYINGNKEQNSHNNINEDKTSLDDLPTFSNGPNSDDDQSDHGTRTTQIITDRTCQDHFYQNHSPTSLQQQPQNLQHQQKNYSKSELQILRKNLSILFQSGFYLGRLTSEESRRLLSDKKLGTFLIRDSTNPAYILSLGVQTVRGATSIRIFFNDGVFGLETDVGTKYAHTFESVLHLVQHYVMNPNKNVLVESSGRCDTPVLLQLPMRLTVPRLSHVVRLKINEFVAGRSLDRLPTIPSLKTYLQQYPFSV